jgi:maltose-binding protein MalE
MNFISGNAWSRLSLFLIILLMTGCSQLPIPGLDLNQQTGEVLPSATPITTQAPATPSPEASPSPAAVTLRIWLPPEFDPEAGTPHGDLLKARLDEFQQRRPNVKVEARIKEIEGPGGMINTLTTASSAAPLALPDLVALPRRAVDPAVQKGLLYPFEHLGELAQANWFEYTRTTSDGGNIVYSLPFAGDTLVLVYRPELIETPPLSWEALRQIQYPLLFPAASPQAFFTLALYQASGGEIQDEDGRPMLQQGPLTGVYIFYQQASSGEQMPFWLTQFETDQQVWQAYQEGRAPMAVTWLSNYLTERPDDSEVSQIPTLDGNPFTLATGWGWVLPNPDPTRRELSTELAVFLSEASFLGRWTLASGYLPPRQEVLDNWFNVPLQALAQQMIRAAYPVPSPDILGVLGPALQETTGEVLKQQETPSNAAEQAINRVNSP